MKATGTSPMALSSCRGRTAVGALAMLLILLCSALTSSGLSPIVPAETGKVLQQDSYGRLPLYFLKNEGQLCDAVKYYEKGLGHSIFYTDKEILFQFETSTDRLPAGFDGKFRRHAGELSKVGLTEVSPRYSQVHLYPVGMHKDVMIEGAEPQEAKVNYFIGKDPNQWKTNIPTYGAIVYRGAYPGIDLKFYGSNQRLEYDLIINAGADPAQVRFGYSGIQNLDLTAEGDLHLVLPDGGTLIHKKPVAYQEINGKRHDVEGSFAVESLPRQTSSDQEEQFVFGFKVAAYDRNYPLIIDPVLVYSTYLGGLSSDTGYAIAVDSSGCAYVTGRTSSTSFPTKTGSLDTAFGGETDAFVTKLNAAGTALVYSTYLGGSSADSANAIALDTSGYAYLTGDTTSTDFPTVNPYSIALASEGLTDAFVVKLNASGSALIYATYLGGNQIDTGLGIAVDSSGLAYVTGETSSSNFPIVGSALQTIFGGGYADAFLTKFNAAGSVVTFSTYWGGNDADAGYAIALDSSNIYLAGETASADFFTVGGVQTGYGGGDSDAFVLNLDRSSLTVVYSTYLGGSDGDYGRGIAVNSDGNAYITGITSSSDFPLGNALQSAYGGGTADAFVAKLSEEGDSLLFSTYLGGAGDDLAYAIAVDSKGNAYVTGKTSGSFVLAKAIQSDYGGGGSDAFVSRIESSGDELSYSTYLGGSAVDIGYGIATGTSGNVYVTGRTSSLDFPTTTSTYMTANGGGFDAFVSKLNALLADFSATPTSGTYPLTVAFTDLSEGTITSRLWNFGDNSTNSTSTDKDPTHIYTSAGTYTVSLKVVGTGGTDTETRSGYIKVAVPEVTISATKARVPETGGGNGEFTVTRSAYTTGSLIVYYTVAGTATSGTDFAALLGSVTIPAGASSAVLSVTPIWDKVYDGNETVVVTLSSSSVYTVGSPESATLTILDSDLPTVTVSASVASVTEQSSQSGLLLVSRSGITTDALTVYYAVSGTATSGTDFTALSGSVTLPVGSSSASIPVWPVWDQVYDGPKTVVVTLSSNSLYTLGSPGSAQVTIVDSDVPTVTIAAAASSIPESGSQTGQYVVTHTGTTSLALTVTYAVSGTAVSGTNFVALTGSITIPVGSASATISLTPKQDSVYGGDKTVVVTLSSNSAYQIGSPSAATITIVESDLPTVTVGATQPSATEASVAGQFTIYRTGITTGALTVSYTVGGTATPGVTYTALTGTVSIPATAASATITVQPLDNALWEGPTTVILTLTATGLYNTGSPSSATVTIADNDGPTITIAATRPSVTEDDAGKGQFTVTRSAHADVALTVSYTVSGTATTGTDYIALPGTVNIPANSYTATILVTPAEDGVTDGDKTVVVTITGSEWYKTGSPSSATVTIVDIDLPTVSIAATVASVLEQGAATAQFTVSRSGSLTSALAVSYTTGGTAISGFDYSALSGSITIPADTSSAIINVTPLWDQSYDGDKTLVLTVAGSSLYNVGSPTSASATIVDQDVPTVTLTASVPTTWEEASDSAVFLVTHSGITTHALTVSYTVEGTATNGVDYSSLFGTVTIPAGSSSNTIQVVPIDDSISDDAETVVLTLASSSLYKIGSPGTATATIYESGAPTVTVVATTPSATEATVAGQFTVYRTKLTTEALTVGYTITGTAVGGNQYTALDSSVTIPVGAASATITVQPLENTSWDGPTTVSLTLSPSGLYDLGSASSATVTIADNDGPAVYMTEVKNAAYEAGPVAGQIKVARTDGLTVGAVPVAYSIGGTASNGVDYETLTGTIVIPDGSASAIIQIVPIDDALDEAKETVILALVENGWFQVGWPSTATVNIYDNDLPAVTVTAIDDNASESGSNNGIFRVARDANGIITSSLDVYYTVGGTATNGVRYVQLGGSVSIPAEASFADITVTPYNDTTYQGNETVTLKITSTSLYTAASPDNATITIVDNEIPTVTITAPVGTIDENGTTPGVFRVSRNGTATGATALEVNYSVGGTAVQATDYEASFSSSVTIPAGEAAVDLEIIPLDNVNKDGTRSVSLTLLDGSGYTIGSASSAVVSIVDDEMPSVTVTAIDALASENATDTGTFRILRNGDLSDPMEITLTIGGSAVADTDYSALPGSVTIPANEASVDLLVLPLENQTAQLNKTVILTLSSTSSYYVGSPNEATVTIIDDDAPVVSITALRNATESGTKGQFQISRIGNIVDALTVKFTVSGTAVKNVNYKALPSQMTILAGETSRILSVTPIDDNQTTGDLTVRVTLSAADTYLSGSPDNATIAITDEDLPVVTVVATDPYAVEQSLNKGVFTITRTRVSNSALTVKYTVGGTANSGVDYKKLAGTVKIAAGAASAVVNVTPIDDNTTDLNRKLTLTLKTDATYSLGTPSAAVVNISDSGLPEISLTVDDRMAAKPSDGETDTGKFRISRVGATTDALSVKYTIKGSAKNGTDYKKLSGTATIPKDAAAVIVKVTPLAGGTVLDNETVILTLAENSAYTLSSRKTGTVTIRGDNLPVVNVAAKSPSASETGPTAGVFTITRTGDTYSAATISFALSGTAKNGTDYQKILGSADIPRYASYVDITVMPVTDALTEGSETVILTITPTLRYSVGSSGSATVTITDD